MQHFFSPIRPQLSRPQYHTLLIFVIGWLLSPRRPKLGHLAGAEPIRHRTSLGHFLKQSQWDPENLLTLLTLAVLRWLGVRDEEIYLLLDDTLIRKRGRRMPAVTPLYDHALQRTYHAHRVLVAAVVVRDIVLPWRFVLWQPQSVGSKYVKVTTLAAELIRNFPTFRGVQVQVLFDAYYLNATVAKACQERDFAWFSVAAKNRRFHLKGQKKSVRLGHWAPGRLQHQGQRLRRPRARNRKITWRVASVVGDLAKIGRVKLVLAKRWRQRDAKLTVFATSDTTLSIKKILGIYERRWMIEQYFKELKGSLGLGQYQMQSQEGIVKHLHLCGLVHLTLTRHSLDAVDAPARKAKKALTLPTLSQRLVNLQQALREERMSRIIKRAKNPSLLTKLQRLLRLAA
jgi:SRSO17 transposase